MYMIGTSHKHVPNFSCPEDGAFCKKNNAKVQVRNQKINSAGEGRGSVCGTRAIT